MLRSLRFQLPALFLLGVVVAGLVSAVISLRLFRSYAEDRARQQAYGELGREAQGLTELYARRAGLKLLSARNLELATGDRIYYTGLDPFPGEGRPAFRLRALPKGVVNTRAFRQRQPRPPSSSSARRGATRRCWRQRRPLRVGDKFFGVIVVAKRKTVLNQRWLALVERLLIAFAGGIAVAAAFAWYLSRRITTPVLELSRAADEVARGRYDVAVPEVPGGGEIGLLADRFREMAARLSEAEELERNFLMSVSHELRTPLTAIRGHVEALREGVVTDEDLRAASLTVIAAEAARLERLVGDVLDLAKLDARRFTVLQEEVDMERLVDAAYAAFGEEARRRGIDYRRTVDAKPVIVTDGDRVLQIISNLLSNAFRWTPDGGRIELELDASDGIVARGGGRQRARHPTGRAGAHLPCVLVARRRRHRTRPGDRARARLGPRRQHPARELSGAREPLRARAPGASRIVRIPARWPPLPRSSSCRSVARPCGQLSWPCARGQWSKNLLVFAGLVFAAQLGDASRWLEACAAFVAYCAISSAAYLLNDVRDREDDRLHPVKRARPIARGELSPRAALSLAAGPVRAGLRAGRAARAGLGPVSPRLRGAAGRLHAAAQARRAAGRARDRCALRDPGRGGSGRGRRSHLTVATALHGAARALPRAGEAPRGAGARRGEAGAWAAGARGVLARARRPARRDRRLVDRARLLASTR